MADIHNPCYLGGRNLEDWGWGQQGQNVRDPNKPDVVESIYQFSYQGGINRITQAKSQDPSPKITKAKKAGGMAQVVERLPNKQNSEFKCQYFFF
jgi:hypothetical protein